jgi:hypothetical protein
MESFTDSTIDDNLSLKAIEAPRNIRYIMMDAFFGSKIHFHFLHKEDLVVCNPGRNS